MLHTLRNVVFWIALTFIFAAVLSILISQISPYEFSDKTCQYHFYEIIIFGLPIALFLTLTRTFNNSNTSTQNWITFCITPILSVVLFIGLFSSLFMINFGAWDTRSILYQHKSEDRVIVYQIYDVGAFGYAGNRVVEIKPFLHFWIEPIAIDTTQIDTSVWSINSE